MCVKSCPVAWRTGSGTGRVRPGCAPDPRRSVLCQAHDRLNRDQNHCQRGTKDRYEQKNGNGVDDAAAAIVFPVCILLHAPGRPNPAVKYLPQLVQNVHTGAEVPVGTTVRVSQAAEKVNLELPPAATLRARLPRETTQPRSEGRRGGEERRV